jgi:hypothetical protein
VLLELFIETAGWKVLGFVLPFKNFVREISLFFNSEPFRTVRGLKEIQTFLVFTEP